jgi:hypothetical protein
MRAVIWAVVGLVVVAAIAIFVYMKNQDSKIKQAGMPTAAEIKRDVDQFNQKADEYVTEVKKLRATLGAQLTDEKKAELAKADSVIAEIRAVAGKLGSLKGDRLLNAKRGLQDLQQAYANLKHDLEKK